MLLVSCVFVVREVVVWSLGNSEAWCPGDHEEFRGCVPCPSCHGVGHMSTTVQAVLAVLRVDDWRRHGPVAALPRALLNCFHVICFLGKSSIHCCIQDQGYIQNHFPQVNARGSDFSEIVPPWTTRIQTERQRLGHTGVCIYIYIYIYIYICMYVCVHTRIYIYIHTHTHTCIIILA